VALLADLGDAVETVIRTAIADDRRIVGWSYFDRDRMIRRALICARTSTVFTSTHCSWRVRGGPGCIRPASSNARIDFQRSTRDCAVPPREAGEISHAVAFRGRHV